MPSLSLPPSSLVEPVKIVVVGGTGLIGSQVVRYLRQAGHEVVPASPSTGVNVLTGEGLAEAMAGAAVLVDVANSPSFEDRAVLEFFETSGRHLRDAAEAAGIRHHVALSVVGTDRLPGSGYFRAKLAQETLIRAAATPFTILRATQFFEFIPAITASAGNADPLPVSSAQFQPVAAADVAAAVAALATADPVQSIVEIAGPECAEMHEFIGRWLRAAGDSRQVSRDPQAGYFGAVLEERSLTPPGDHFTGGVRFEDWLRDRAPQP